MNMIILEPEEKNVCFLRSDRRCRHLTKILKVAVGDRLKAGCTDGTIGTAIITALDETGCSLRFEAEAEAPPLAPITVILGFPRPIQAARIYRELCTLGISRILATGTDLGEKSYLMSDFYAHDEYRFPLLEGAEQACNPRLPQVSKVATLNDCFQDPEILQHHETKLYFHPAQDAPLLGSTENLLKSPILLVIGSERGWSKRETGLLESCGLECRSLGTRILRTETAAEAAVSISLSRIGWM